MNFEDASMIMKAAATVVTADVYIELAQILEDAVKKSAEESE